MIISRSIHIAANGNISFLCPSSIHRILKNTGFRSSLVSQQVKDPVLSLPWYGFDPWPGNFHLLWGWWKKYWLVIRKNISRKLLMRKKKLFYKNKKKMQYFRTASLCHFRLMKNCCSLSQCVVSVSSPA